MHAAETPTPCVFATKSHEESSQHDRASLQKMQAASTLVRISSRHKQNQAHVTIPTALQQAECVVHGGTRAYLF